MVISGNTEISLLLFYIFQDNHLLCVAFGFFFFLSVENFLFDNQQKAVKEAEGGGGQRKKKDQLTHK